MSQINETRRRTHSEEPDFYPFASKLGGPHPSSCGGEGFAIRSRIRIGSGTARVEVGIFIAVGILEGSVESDRRRGVDRGTARLGVQSHLICLL